MPAWMGCICTCRSSAAVSESWVNMQELSICMVAVQYCQGDKSLLLQGVDAGDTVALFTRILGVYLHMTDEEIPADVKKWNVKLLRLNRHNRHTDMAEAGHFYSELDKHLNAHPVKAASLAF